MVLGASKMSPSAPVPAFALGEWECPVLRRDCSGDFLLPSVSLQDSDYICPAIVRYQIPFTLFYINNGQKSNMGFYTEHLTMTATTLQLVVAARSWLAGFIS